MNDHATTVLTSRLHQVADDLARPLDVVGLVRDARAGHQRRRRMRIAALAAATATAVLLVGVPLTLVSLASAPTGQVAGPSSATPTAVEPGDAMRRAAEEALRRAQQAAEQAATGLPAGWEPRDFQGVTFGVPSAARKADTVEDVPVSSWTEGPSLTWNGPLLVADQYSFVTVKVVETFQGGLTPLDQGDWFTVPGAEKAYGGIDTVDVQGRPAPTTTVWLHLLDGDRQIVVDAQFAAGPDGEQMAHDLIDSLAIEQVATGTPATVVPPGWESRSFQGVEFAVPPGARMDDYVHTDNQAGCDSCGEFIWNGPDVGGDRKVYAHIKVVVLGNDAPQDLAASDGYDTAVVRGAQQAYVSVGSGDISDVDDQPFTVLDMGLEAWTASGRHVHVDAVLPVGSAGEQMVRDLVASIVIR